METWFAHMSDEPGKSELHVYTRSDACGAAETWAVFLGKKQEDLLGSGFTESQG